MYIKRIELEGFKSYASKVILDNFDPHFNAITGLNGTGKSNVLDAICFVLGLSSLAKARINNLNGFIYKEGQAGVQKAIVTLYFDNKDKKESPSGYEEYKEISVTRIVSIGNKNKYLINGIIAQSNRVFNLFQSIHLNINNPHFIIMQGRVSQVLSMSPKHILEMIQEVSGTRIYENKRLTAMKIISKKDFKLEEISKVLETEIEPKLNRLENERIVFREWQEITTKLEKSEIAKKNYLIFSSFNKINSLNEKKNNLQYSIKNLVEKIKDLNLKVSMDKNNKNNNDYELLDNLILERKKIEKELIQQESKLEFLEKNLKKNLLELEQIEKNKKTENENCISLREKLQIKKNEYDRINSEIESLEVKLKILDGNKNDYEFCLQIKTKILDLENERKSLIQKIESSENILNNKEKEFLEDKDKYDNYIKELKNLNTRKKEIDVLYENHKEKKFLLEEKNKKIQNLKKLISEKKTELSSLEISMPYELEHKKQYKGLIGIIAELCQSKKEEYYSAIEASAGNKLLSLVVDTANTASQIFKDKILKKRNTIIPLDKIVTNSLKKSEIKGIGISGLLRGDELIEFNDKFKTAIEFIFGRIIFCQDSETAQKTAYSKNIDRKDFKVVNFEGDTFSPVGTISGGYRNKKSNIFSKMEKFKVVSKIIEMYYKEIKGHERIIENIENELNENKDIFYQKKEIDRKIEEMNKKLSLGKDLLEDNNFEETKKILYENKIALEEKNSRIINYQNNLKELENFNAGAENFDNLNSELKFKKDQKEKIKKILNDFEIKFAQLNEKLKEIEITKKELNNKISEFQNESEKINLSINNFKSKNNEINFQIREEENKKIENEKLEIEYEKENKNSKKELKKCQNDLNDKKKDLEKIENEIKNNQENYDKNLDENENNPEIAEKKYCDFLKENKIESSEKFIINDYIKDLQLKLDKISGKVNKKVFIMQENTIKEFENLIRKRNTVLKDKKRLLNVLQNLDKKKSAVLNEAWKDVNNNFGAIFGSLLPGNSCELKNISEKNIEEGLEIRVRLGEKWKSSLSELSGGQKSLLALSLILSLLKFKKAPMYILDEIDAALDLTHTQNIGVMLKKYFNDSQFIIVSLKEGLFQNANVVFRTKFEGGVSSVSRNQNK